MEKNNFLFKLKSRFCSYINDKIYMISLILTAIGSYGFLITHFSVSVDDLESVRYYSGELIAQGRLSASIFHKFFYLTDNFIWFQDFLGIVFLCISVILFCICFDRFIKTENHIPQTVFSCIFVSYPIHSELFSYNGCAVAIGGGCCLVALALLMLISYRENKSLKYALFSVVFLFFAVSWYESLLIIFIGAVFMFLLLEQFESAEKKKIKDLFFDGIKFAIPLAVAVAAEFAVSTAVRIILHIEPSSRAATDIGLGMYVNYNPLHHITHLLIPNIVDLIVASTYYVPITILFFTLLVMVGVLIFDLIKKHNLGIFICEICSMLLLMEFTVIQYSRPIYRISQYYAFFVAFSAFFIYYRISKSSVSFKKTMHNAFTLIMIIVTVWQVSSINYYFTTDNLRYEYEKSIMTYVGEELIHNFDTSKPVVFLGKVTMSEEVTERSCVSKNNKLFGKLAESKLCRTFCPDITKSYESGPVRIQDTNCQSYINWSIIAFEGNGTLTVKFLKYLGYDGITPGSKEQYKEAWSHFEEIPNWPDKNCITDMGDYIVVNLNSAPKK